MKRGAPDFLRSSLPPAKRQNRQELSQKELEQLTYFFQKKCFKLSDDDFQENLREFFQKHNDSEIELDFNSKIDGRTVFCHLMELAILGKKPIQHFIQMLSEVMFEKIDWNSCADDPKMKETPFSLLLSVVCMEDWARKVFLTFCSKVSFEQFRANRYSRNLSQHLLANSSSIYILFLMRPDLFCRVQYHGTSIDNIRKVTGIYLKKMYYLFENNEFSYENCITNAPEMIKEGLDFFSDEDKIIILNSGLSRTRELKAIEESDRQLVLLNQSMATITMEETPIFITPTYSQNQRRNILERAEVGCESYEKVKFCKM